MKYTERPAVLKSIRNCHSVRAFRRKNFLSSHWEKEELYYEWGGHCVVSRYLKVCVTWIVIRYNRLFSFIFIISQFSMDSTKHFLSTHHLLLSIFIPSMKIAEKKTLLELVTVLSNPFLETVKKQKIEN